ncbi:MAG TPA: class I adenylate-forming enzyme family protein [Bryobacteraceae bacterium]|nr:class I adenylate-forming enzyme family protein [Bryobacteraceae bacterium]
MTIPIPQVTLDEFERQPLRLLHSAVDYWAAERPNGLAVRNATRGTQLTWRELREGSLAVASALARLGFRKGDVLAAWLPLLNEHILLEYACFRLGVIHAPLDLRLQPAEALRSLELTRARGLAFLGKLGPADFAEAAAGFRSGCASLEHLIQFSPPDDCIPGAVSFSRLLSAAPDEPPAAELSEYDGAQVIFTTGSTGSPKPALLSHRGIACQNLCLARAFDFGPHHRVLCNLPASHVGGQAEVLMTTLFSGGTAVTLETFDPVKSLDAIERYGVTLAGQIPAMFQLEWRTADYARRNLSSLLTAVYGGQAAPRAFLDQMRLMAPRIATGLGLTEASGFCTYTPLTPEVDAVAEGLGWSMPAYRMSVRRPMDAGGAAGAELPAGETGHICFQGPQNFLGYLNDAEATAATLSTDGVLYTGDMGSLTERGLHLSGRAKWVLKPAGYQVFPGDVEAHFAALGDRVANAGLVGQPHRVWSEGIIAFVEKRAGAELTEADLRRHARTLTSYMRPLHYVILEPGAMPLNRTAKVDMKRLQEMAKAEVESLRARGRWDG